MSTRIAIISSISVDAADSIGRDRGAGGACLFGGAGLGARRQYPTGSLSTGYLNGDDPADDEIDYFSGEVDAGKSSCFQNRKVVIWGDVPGVDVRVGEDRTTEAGEYKVFGEDVAEGSYYAEADRRTLKLTVDHRHVCRAVRSQDISAAP